MYTIHRFRPISAALAIAGALFSVSQAAAQSHAYADPASQYPAAIFRQAMPQESIAPEPDAAKANIPAHLRRTIVDYAGREAAGTVIVDTPNTTLYYVLGNGKAVRYGIGVGREGFTWSGTKSVERKAEWPDWTPPAEMLSRQPYLPRFMAGGPGNPMGARALYIGGTVYRIHGTNAPSSIGKRVSSGCIRMLNEDVIDLYARVKLGTKVVVLPMNSRGAPVAASPRSRSASAAPARPRTMSGVY